MFRKQVRIKSNTQLKASERKKIRLEILQQFSVLTNEDLDLLLPNKEIMCCIKLFTNNTRNLTVFSIQKYPLIFEVEKIMYPTVYMLWKLPHILPLYTTTDYVTQKIMDGANLMLPGLVTINGSELSNSFHIDIKRGDKVAVNTSSNKAAIAVGVAVMNSSEMNLSQGKGVCVQILHTYNDKLWSLESTLDIPFIKAILVDNINRVPEINTMTQNATPENDTIVKEDDIITKTAQLSVTQIPDYTDIDKENPSSGINENDKKNDSNENDDLLMYSFLKSLCSTVKTVSLPLFANVFYKVHMLEACPPGHDLDLKKTKYKKLSKFLVEMANLGIINIECFTKGVLSITSIYYEHKLFKEFTDDHRQELRKKGSSVNSTVSKKGPEITENYTINATVLPVFSKFMYKKNDTIGVQDIRKLITRYVKVENLQDPNNKQLVMLDPCLSCILGTKDRYITWELLMTKIITKMGQCYQVWLPGNHVISAKGKLPPIELIVANRTGCKKVTLVNNLEVYGVNIHEFARECQHGVAASSTINNPPGAKSAQVQIQGNQIIFIGKLLTEQYKIPKRYIRGLEEASTKKQK